VYFERPSGRHRLGSEEWDTAAGDLLLIAPGEIHGWDTRTANRPPAVWIVRFAANALAPSRPEAVSVFHLARDPLLFPFLRASQGVSGRHWVPREERAAWGARLRALQEELSASRPGHQEASRAYLTLLLVAAARLAPTDRHPGRDQPLLARVFAVIEARYRTPISLADVARAVGRSPGYLTRQVRRLTGRTVLEWITERRMAEVRRLLLETDLAVERIAEQISYTDPTYLIRRFRRLHGTTPAAWRRARRGGVG
jgi:AraC-like DNA-binding protein